MNLLLRLKRLISLQCDDGLCREKIFLSSKSFLYLKGLSLVNKLAYINEIATNTVMKFIVVGIWYP